MARKTLKQKRLEEKYETIREELLEQLRSRGKFGRFYDDLVDHAVYFFRLKDELQQDIIDKGLRVEVMTGNGYIKEVANESVRNLNSVSAQLMRIMRDLGLDEPEIVDDEDDSL